MESFWDHAEALEAVGLWEQAMPEPQANVEIVRAALQRIGPNTDLRIVSTRNLVASERISLKGSFAYDALSPDGKKLYLIQHSSVDDLQHYVVRAYDLDAHALLPGRIADKAQKSWVMQGFPTARTSSLDGRWVFTLYMNPGGYPFIHALDTVRAVAHCVGLPWASSNQGALSNAVLSLRGKTLAVHWTSGKSWPASRASPRAH